MTTHKRKITVIGHKNPDTDSICSAIAYAELKNRLTGSDLYVPRRAGGMNAETRFVLNYFKADVPELVEDVGTQVKDIPPRCCTRERMWMHCWRCCTVMRALTAVLNCLG